MSCCYRAHISPLVLVTRTVNRLTRVVCQPYRRRLLELSMGRSPFLPFSFSSPYHPFPSFFLPFSNSRFSALHSLPLSPSLPSPVFLLFPYISCSTLSSTLSFSPSHFPINPATGTGEDRKLVSSTSGSTAKRFLL